MSDHECRCRQYEAAAKLCAADVAYWVDYENPRLVIFCSDTFAFACADAEPVPNEDIDLVARVYAEHQDAGVMAWVAHRRGIDPLSIRCASYGDWLGIKASVGALMQPGKSA
jgi:hypothetical protein